VIIFSAYGRREQKTLFGWCMMSINITIAVCEGARVNIWRTLMNMLILTSSVHLDYSMFVFGAFSLEVILCFRYYFGIVF
jgi:hypothetical protein